jgi:hypothetical protein
VHAYGKSSRLGPFSFARVGRNQLVEGRHSEHWVAQNTKLFLAKLWALAGGRM